ncbi:primosomal protein N' [Haloimpatiens lingqiaonensis]|uniref:primosomal protein N' n=1 Tax=Haloimpatiens lingqiaonensis TaxID=1380675 RepID=UPI0010FDAE4F|nr:primosomal protein N' [Haloimpatiens lingqiaonensis]
MYKYAGVIVDNESEQVDRVFTYGIPEKIAIKVEVGLHVKVPFGRGNRVLDAYIVELYENLDKKIKGLKYVKSICEEYPLLSLKDLELIEKMKNKYICTYIECIKTIVPSGIIKGIGNKTNNVICLGKSLDQKFNKKPYNYIHSVVEKNNGVYNKTSLSNKFSLSLSSINTMIKHGFLLQNEIIVNRYNYREYECYKEKQLNKHQKDAVETILNSSKNISLIHGVTGSGKTEIYMHLVSQMIKENKDSIILVPEISLTPQMVERFKGRFGRDIAVFHSKLSPGERIDEWIRVKNKEVKVAVGARSALFLPFSNLGLIVIDEEHESSYKSESSPKYTAVEVAELISEIQDCKVVLGSATPSINTYHRAINGEINLITINSRVDGASFPEVKVVDMREELLNNNRSIFSRELFYSIKDRLNKKEQIILFLNRRGFSTFISCRACGYVFKCPNCDISLTYHQDSSQLNCHYCGSNVKVPKECPQCGSKYVKYFGIGTERVERDIKKFFPEARTLRMDFDTTRKKNSYEYIYESFKNKHADILIGTQMIAKGLDFKDVTLVGIIAADLSLNMPDFRANERTYQIVTQVSGRAGRGVKPGKVVIQTYSPENYSIQYAACNDYIGFYEKEINLRKDMKYPPFSDILCINMSSEREDILIKNIQNVGIYLNKILVNYDKINLLGPCPCALSKIKSNYRWQIILKGEVSIELARKIKNIIYELIKEDYNNIRINIDINPNNML